MADKMQKACAWVEINDLHDNCRMPNLTPAEALVVRKQFGVKVAGQAKPTNPITHLDIDKDSIDRSKDDEFQRLARKYGSKLIEAVFPGENPNIPLTFKEAGFEATEESAPKAGKMHEVIPLAKLPKTEIIDEQSETELAAKKAQEVLVKAQADEIVKLKEQLASKAEVVKK